MELEMELERLTDEESTTWPEGLSIPGRWGDSNADRLTELRLPVWETAGLGMFVMDSQSTPRSCANTPRPACPSSSARGGRQDGSERRDEHACDDIIQPHQP